MFKRMGFVINTKRCVGCKTCTISCKMENNVSPGLARIRVMDDHYAMVYDKPAGVYPNLKRNFVAVPCQHCDNPPCVPVCPTGASQVREDGIVFVEKNKCIGCGYCGWACPYGSRQMDEENGVIDKCTFCMHRLDEDKKPMCVLCCPSRALVYGDLNDPSSEVSQLVNSKPVRSLKQEQGTKPSVYYIF